MMRLQNQFDLKWNQHMLLKGIKSKILLAKRGLSYDNHAYTLIFHPYMIKLIIHKPNFKLKCGPSSKYNFRL